MRERRSTAPQFVVPPPAAPERSPAPSQAELAPILDPSRNHWLHQRPIDPALRAQCAAIAEQRAFRREHIAPAAELSIETLVDARFGRALRAFLEADIARWAKQYSALTGVDRCKVTLAAVWSDACRKFHADFVGLRLLCTYAGPGTEFISNEFVSRDVELDTSRSIEAISQANAQMIADPSAVRRAHEGDVLVLKGELWPHNRGRGAMHRSPPIEAAGQRRLVLTIDAPNPALGEHVH